MKIEWIDEQSGRSGLVVKELARYDGTPRIDSYWLDQAPLTLNQDRLAVVSTIIFGRWSIGALVLPKQVGAATARELMKYCEPHWIIPEPIDYGPKPVPGGPGRLFVRQEGRRYKQPIAPERMTADFTITILDSDEFAGSLSSMNELKVASNAFAFQQMDTSRRHLPLLAVAILFAEDLRCSTICLEAEYVDELRSLASLQMVLGTVGLQLEII